MPGLFADDWGFSHRKPLKTTRPVIAAWQPPTLLTLTADMCSAQSIRYGEKSQGPLLLYLLRPYTRFPPCRMLTECGFLWVYSRG